jgi:Uncharacterized protein conserved in archaea
MTRMNNHAVSPVVGVMLMLVVTIIIAAIVSAFAGGLSESNEKAPNVQIIGHYSQSQGMWIENDGPDDISTMSTNVWVRCSDSFGNAEHMVWQVNKSSISQYNVTGQPANVFSGGLWKSDFWLNGGGSTSVKSWKVGERAYLYPPFQKYEYLQPGASLSYRFNSPANLGNSFWVELTDKSGKIFAKTKVKIEA